LHAPKLRVSLTVQRAGAGAAAWMRARGASVATAAVLGSTLLAAAAGGAAATAPGKDSATGAAALGAVGSGLVPGLTAAWPSGAADAAAACGTRTLARLLAAVLAALAAGSGGAGSVMGSAGAEAALAALEAVFSASTCVCPLGWTAAAALSGAGSPPLPPQALKSVPTASDAIQWGGRRGGNDFMMLELPGGVRLETRAKLAAAACFGLAGAIVGRPI